MNELIEMLVCPNCRSSLLANNSELICKSCSKNWQINDGIPIFFKGEEWQSSKSKLRKLEEDIRNMPFEVAMSKNYGSGATYRIGKERATKIINFLKSKVNLSEAKVLDLGCNLGGLSINIAKVCKKLFSVDAYQGVLRIVQIRKTQDKLENLLPLSANAFKIPLPDNSLDLVLLSGVLEWIPINNRHISPDKAQELALEECRRILKPNGLLYLAIENRFGFQYFKGCVDGHSGLRFISLMPRFLAQLYMRARLGKRYETYLYSYLELKKILRKTGFRYSEFFGAIPTYRKPERIIPLDNKKYYIKSYEYNNSPNGASIPKIFHILFPISKHMINNFIILSKK